MSMKKNKKIVFIVAGCGIVMLLGVIAANYMHNRYIFLGEDKNINQYIQSLKATRSISDVWSEKHCSYNSQKYSKGSLGCTVEYSFLSALDEETQKEITSKLALLKWVYKWDNTTSINEYSDKKYINHKVYSDGTLDCIYSVAIANASYQYQMNCYGPAKAEWYPVRNS